jgi:hypothetical protein
MCAISTAKGPAHRETRTFDRARESLFMLAEDLPVGASCPWVEDMDEHIGIIGQDQRPQGEDLGQSALACRQHLVIEGKGELGGSTVGSGRGQERIGQRPRLDAAIDHLVLGLCQMVLGLAFGNQIDDLGAACDGLVALRPRNLGKCHAGRGLEGMHRSLGGREPDEVFV